MKKTIGVKMGYISAPVAQGIEHRIPNPAKTLSDPFLSFPNFLYNSLQDKHFQLDPFSIHYYTVLIIFTLRGGNRGGKISRGKYEATQD
ncbi:MAG: hypothetical protein ACLFV2_06565 [Desulfurivibrionaceae bacterium]